MACRLKNMLGKSSFSIDIQQHNPFQSRMYNTCNSNVQLDALLQLYIQGTASTNYSNKSRCAGAIFLKEQRFARNQIKASQTCMPGGGPHVPASRPMKHARKIKLARKTRGLKRYDTPLEIKAGVLASKNEKIITRTHFTPDDGVAATNECQLKPKFEHFTPDDGVAPQMHDK